MYADAPGWGSAMRSSGPSGARLGAGALPTVLLWATCSALVCVLVASRRNGSLTGASRVPFGPFLGFGTWLAWLTGRFET